MGQFKHLGVFSKAFFICSWSGSAEMWQVIKLEEPSQRSELHDVQSHLTLLLLLPPQISPYLLIKMLPF